MYPCGRTRRSKDHRLYSALFLAGTALLILAKPAVSNVLPDATVQVHVRAPEPPGQEGCTIPGIHTCGDIVNSTELTGEVEFDIFAQPWPSGPEDQLVHLETTLTWPATWQFVRWEECNGAGACSRPMTESST